MPSNGPPACGMKTRAGRPAPSRAPPRGGRYAAEGEKEGDEKQRGGDGARPGPESRRWSRRPGRTPRGHKESAGRTSRRRRDRACRPGRARRERSIPGPSRSAHRTTCRGTATRARHGGREEHAGGEEDPSRDFRPHGLRQRGASRPALNTAEIERRFLTSRSGSSSSTTKSARSPGCEDAPIESASDCAAACVAARIAQAARGRPGRRGPSRWRRRGPGTPTCPSRAPPARRPRGAPEVFAQDREAAPRRSRSRDSAHGSRRRRRRIGSGRPSPAAGPGPPERIREHARRRSAACRPGTRRRPSSECRRPAGSSSSSTVASSIGSSTPCASAVGAGRDRRLRVREMRGMDDGPQAALPGPPRSGRRRCRAAHPRKRRLRIAAPAPCRRASA